ncbi:MAG: hypothetical protein ABI690_02410 [Chloroflexota bacterium]
MKDQEKTQRKGARVEIVAEVAGGKHEKRRRIAKIARRETREAPLGWQKNGEHQRECCRCGGVALSPLPSWFPAAQSQPI